MARPFTADEYAAIRARLLASATRHAVTTGVKKTSLEMLTDDAGISKSTFYRFYERKELLFLEVADAMEQQILSAARHALSASAGLPGRQRAANMVFSIFSLIRTQEIGRFLLDDLPLLLAELPQQHDLRSHFLGSAQGILSMLIREGIRFNQPQDVILTIIHMLFLAALQPVGSSTTHLAALESLVTAACYHSVAADSSDS